MYIKRLDISGNQIGDQGAFAFAHALTMNKSFAHFSIRNNAISPPGLLAVATALLVCSPDTHKRWKIERGRRGKGGRRRGEGGLDVVFSNTIVIVRINQICFATTSVTTTLIL